MARNLMKIFPEIPGLDPGPMKGGERTYNLQEELVMPNGDVVHKGFNTDGASIPRCAQWLIGAHDGPYFPAAIGHDWRYQYSFLKRKEVDKLFLQDMIECGVSWWRRKAMYRAVRFGAGIPWRKYRSRNK